MKKDGSDEIPALVLEDGTAITGDADTIISYLDHRYSERVDAPAHQERSREQQG